MNKIFMVETMKEKQKIIVFQAGGQYFFWQMGVVQYLGKHFLLDDIQIVGASAGALAAVFLVCQIDAETALKQALHLCEKMNVWDRWLKFVGIWGDMVKTWLEELLPENAAELCRHKVHIMVSQVLRRKKMIVSDCHTKKDLIECLLASIHIPFFMDYYPFRSFQGRWCYDGCIGNLTNNSYKIFGTDAEYYFFSFQDDKQQHYSILNGLPFSKSVEIADLIQHGYQYAQTLHRKNCLPLPVRSPSRLSGISSVHDTPVDCRKSIPPQEL